MSPNPIFKNFESVKGKLMKHYNLQIHTSAEAERFMTECETDFRTRLDGVVNAVLADDGLRTIALSGPTCSGKTTTADRLIEQIGASGHHAVVISVDDFFLDRNDRNRVDLAPPDYDSVEAIDLDYLDVFLRRLRNRESVLVPKYDFTATRRVGYHEYLPDPLDIYVIEGIQAVYPEVTARLGDYRSIFISVTDDTQVNGVPFDRHEVRLLRRIVRDYNFRGATPEFSFHLWDGVRRNEEKNIFPNAGNCDFYLNSFLPYELFVLREHALPLLAQVSAESVHRPSADRLTEKLAALPELPFDGRRIPQNSVFREFIG